MKVSNLPFTTTNFNIFSSPQLTSYHKNQTCSVPLTLENIRGGGQSDHPPSNFLALNFCSLTDCQKLRHNCSLFVKTSFDLN